MKLTFLIGFFFSPVLAQSSTPLLYIPQLVQEPIIDGDLSEWKDYAHNDGVWDMRRIAQTSFYVLDRGARNRLTVHGDEGSIENDKSARYYKAREETH